LTEVEVAKGIKVFKVLMEDKVYRDLMDLAFKDIKELLVLKDIKEFRVIKVSKDQQVVNRAFKVFKAP